MDGRSTIRAPPKSGVLLNVAVDVDISRRPSFQLVSPEKFYLAGERSECVLKVSELGWVLYFGDDLVFQGRKYRVSLRLSSCRILGA